MLSRCLRILGMLLPGIPLAAGAGGLQRIGHTTLAPRHASPDDKGLYSALVDPANGYAYVVGNYLTKLDITGNLPVPVGTSIYTGQFQEAAIDLASGYLYLTRNSTVFRYAAGVGVASVTSAGSLTLPGSGIASTVLDDSDPDPANHYAYVVCAGSPAQVWKVALSTFQVVSSLTLNTGENAFYFGKGDARNGYAYFLNYSTPAAHAIPQVLKIKMTPGTNAPVRTGIVNLDSATTFIGCFAIDTVHGYLYYGTDGNVSMETIYKVKLGDGDALPTPVPFGGVALRPGEIELISCIVDPQGGYVYFGDDNTYPGRIFQLLLNGPNPPVEMPGYLPLQGGTNSTTPPDGTSILNATTGTDLPYGEVFLHSAVFDPVRGYAYFCQDSRPNQVVKVQVARDLPVITDAAKQQDGSFQLQFANTPYVTHSVLATTDLTLPVASWTLIGTATEVSPGQFQFSDPQAGSFTRRFYRVTAP